MSAHWIIQGGLIIVGGYLIFLVVTPLIEAIGLLLGPLVRRAPWASPPLCLIVSATSVIAGAILILLGCRLIGLGPPLVGILLPAWGLHREDWSRIRAAREYIADARRQGEPAYRLRVRLANEYARLAGDWIGIVAGGTTLANPALWF